MNNEEHYDLDLERMILSSCLLGGGEVYANIAGDIEIKDFSLKAHQDIFKAIVSCVNAGEPIGLSFLKINIQTFFRFLKQYLASYTDVEI
ncbi:DnaB-like helicase N-terminal domain-containing protein [Campylobacter upsaliensis]